MAQTDLRVERLSPDARPGVDATQLDDHQVVARDFVNITSSLIGLSGLPDAAAIDAFAQVASGDYRLSFETYTTVDGTTFDPRDIVATDGSTYSLAVGLSQHGVRDGVNLVGLAPAGDDFYLVFDTDVVLGGMRYEDRDVVRFDPAGGTFTLALAAGLQGVDAAGSISAIDRLANGHWLLSFADGIRVGGQTASEAAILELDPAGSTWMNRGAPAGWQGINLEALDATQQPAGALQFTADAQTVSEGDSVTATVERVNGSEGTVKVDFMTADDTATAPDDYAASSGTLGWADGETADKQTTITTTDDAVAEGNERFEIALSTPTDGASLGQPDVQTVTLVDTGETGGLIFKDSFE